LSDYDFAPDSKAERSDAKPEVGALSPLGDVNEHIVDWERDLISGMESAFAD